MRVEWGGGGGGSLLGERRVETFFFSNRRMHTQGGHFRKIKKRLSWGRARWSVSLAKEEEGAIIAGGKETHE